MPFLPFVVHVPPEHTVDVTSHLGAQSDTGLAPRWSSLIGIVTAIVGNILISFALNIQRYAHLRLHRQREQKGHVSRDVQADGDTNADDARIKNRHTPGKGKDPQGIQRQRTAGSARCEDDDHDDDDAESRTYLSSPYWWAGLVLMTVGEAGNFLAYGFAPASIVSPLGVVALVSNCVIAPVMLKEKFRLQDLAGVVVAVAGAVTVVWSAKQQETRLGPHEIWGAVTRTAFEIYMVVTILLIALLMAASPKYGAKSILIDLGLVGLIGAYTALSTKGVASMLSSTLFKALTSPITYLLLAVLIGSAILQVKYVNKALQRFDSTQVIPVQFVMFTLSVIIGSAVLYRDFERTTVANGAKFVGGCLLTFFGVFLITQGRPRQDSTHTEYEQEAAGTNDKTHSRLTDSNNDRHAPVIISGDAATDAAVEATPRRASRVSFVDARAPRAIVSRRTSRVSPPPPIRLNDEPYDEPAIDGESADEHTPLIRSLASSPAMGFVPPRLQSTVSTPDIRDRYNSTHSPRPSSRRAATQGSFHTHPRQQQGPAPPSALERPRPPTARASSIARIFPGAYTSPLSSGLSAVVAESLRRSVELGAHHHHRGRGLQRDTGRAQSTSSLKTDMSSGQAADHVAVEAGEAESGNLRAVLGRARRLSSTVGELLRWRWQNDEPGESRRSDE